MYRLQICKEINMKTSFYHIFTKLLKYLSQLQENPYFFNIL